MSWPADSRLRCGDCLAVLPELEDESVDLIATDLPYGTTRYGWDSPIPLGPLWGQFRRLLTPRGVVVLTAAQPFTSLLVASNPAWFRYALVWEKPRPINIYQAKVRPLVIHEDILIFTRRKLSNRTPAATYNPPGVLPGKGRKRQGNRSNVITSPRPSHADVYAIQGRGYPRSILRFPGESGLHPTQKPVPLMDYLIRMYSNVGDVVVDCAMGSGTTGVACVPLGRHFVGIERDPGYFSVAATRIARAVRAEAGSIFGPRPAAGPTPAPVPLELEAVR
jgi:site-specific DNA-methyltransferase (adenine-specific)